MKKTPLKTLAGGSKPAGKAATRKTGKKASAAPGPARYEFILSEWLPRFPLRTTNGHYRAEAVTSPSHVCNNVQLREGVADQYEWGQAVPMDLFVMADGEPKVRHVTKAGGVPYRGAKEPWPATKDGSPMLFVAQFLFSNSRDLVGDLPGDVLLLFVDALSSGVESVYTEWRTVGEGKLIAPDDVPPHPDTFAPCHGHRFRTVSHPKAKAAKHCRQDFYRHCRGKEVWSDYLLPQWLGTQIGRAPFFIQEDVAEMPGKQLCMLGSIRPDPSSEYPWINHPRRLALKDARPPRHARPTFADMGSIYLSIDSRKRVHWRLSSF